MATKIQEHLFLLKDEKYLAFHSKLCTTSNKPMIGVRVPLVKQYGKELAKQDDVIFLDEYYEEVLLHGLYIAYKNYPYNQKVELIDKFIPMIDNWAICDCFVSSLKFIKKNKDKYYPYVKKYLCSDKEYTHRFGLVVLLSHYMVDEYINDILNTIKTTTYHGYYSLMAGAWLLSYCFMFYFEKTLHFLVDNNIEEFVYKKAIRKALESYRVSDDNKLILRKLI